jgi:hypothetical protein
VISYDPGKERIHGERITTKAACGEEGETPVIEMNTLYFMAIDKDDLFTV